MKRALVGLIAVAFAVACGEAPAGLPDGAELLRSIVLTEGKSPPEGVWSPAPPARSELDAAASLGGSEADAVTLKPATCGVGSSQEVNITYTVTGRQQNPASFQVFTVWTYDGTAWTGSSPTTVNVAARSAGGSDTYPVTVDLINNSSVDDGTSILIIEPFNLATSSPAALELRNEEVTIHVAFASCPTANTPPTIVVPNTIIEIEATSSSGATVDPHDHVTANDLEDDDLTDDVECEPGAGTFGFGDHTIECSVEDSGGLTDDASFTIRVQDTTAPVFTEWPQSQVDLIAVDIDGAALDLGSLTIEAKDYGPDGAVAGEISPPVTIACAVGSDDADGYQIEIGQKVAVRCSATDARDNHDSGKDVEFDVFVTFDLSSTCGFGPPLHNDDPYSAHRRNSVVPHKICAPSYADGTLATDLAEGLRLVLKWQSGASDGLDQAEEPAAGSTVWRWDEDDEHYIFNAKTAKSWASGTWKTTIEYASIVLAETYLVLK